MTATERIGVMNLVPATAVRSRVLVSQTRRGRYQSEQGVSASHWDRKGSWPPVTGVEMVHA